MKRVRKLCRRAKATVLTISLIVEGHQLNAMQPKQQGVWVCGVDSGGCWVSPEQLARRVLDQFLRVTPAQSLGSILIDRGDVIALGCTDDGAERGGWTRDGRRLLFLPAQALSATYKKERERQKAAAVSKHSSNTMKILKVLTVFIFFII